MICHCLNEQGVVTLLVILAAIGFAVGLYSLK